MRRKQSRAQTLLTCVTYRKDNFWKLFRINYLIAWLLFTILDKSGDLSEFDVITGPSQTYVSWVHVFLNIVSPNQMAISDSLGKVILQDSYLFQLKYNSLFHWRKLSLKISSQQYYYWSGVCKKWLRKNNQPGDVLSWTFSVCWSCFTATFMIA